MASKKGCDCIHKTNRELAKRNGQIDLVLFLGKNITRPKVSVVKLDEKDKTKPPFLLPNYCPFCGSKYPEAS